MDDKARTELRRQLLDLMSHSRRDRFTPPPAQGLTDAETRVVVTVAMLRSMGEEPIPSRIALFARTTPSALSQTLKALEAKGLIERHRSDEDCRRVSVHLTQAGQQKQDECRAMRDRMFDDLISYVGEEDMRNLVRILRKVAAFHEQAVRSSAHGNGSAPCA